MKFAVKFAQRLAAQFAVRFAVRFDVTCASVVIKSTLFILLAQPKLPLKSISKDN